MPYPLRPANPAAVKAKNALFMRSSYAPKSLRRRRRKTRLATSLSAGRPSGRRGAQLYESNVRARYWFRYLTAPAKASQARARPRLHVPKTPAPPSRAALKTTLTIRLQAAERGQPAIEVLADPTPTSAGDAVHNCDRRGGERSDKYTQRSTGSRGVPVCVGANFVCVRGRGMKIPRIAGHLRECRRGKQSRRGASE